jgi:hypothetical protein
MRGCLAAVLAVSALVAGPAQAALRLQLDTGGLDDNGIEASRRLLDAAQGHLPDTMRTSLDRAITVRWSDALDDPVHGRATRDELLLNRDLLPTLESAQGRHHALATVLHELAHFHDRARHRAPSRDPRLLDLAGWQVRATRFTTRLAGRQHDNRFVDRSPDPYELTDPQEFFAVNVEHYLLDAEYACRRPALHRHLAQQLGAAKIRPANCSNELLYVDAGEGEGGSLASIDPARVYAIDYLLAEGNAQPMSRWGHSMLRLVVCAPGRPPGPDCRLDLSHHRVLSFRAFVDDVQISSWRGLTGRYPSRLFVLPMEQVIDEYTRVELRGLRSVPLLLDRDEIAAVLERTAQLHWSYDGRYYFLGNNCAAETWKLLHDSVPRLAAQPLGSITPTGLLRRLQKAHVADATALDNRAEALRLGYRFESQRSHFVQMFAVARQQLALPYADVETWLGLAPQVRRPWLERGDLRTSAALLVLEQAAQRRQTAQVREQLKRRYLEQREGDAFSSDDPLGLLLRRSAYLGRPSQLLMDGGYGIPQPAEKAALAVRSEELRDELRQVRAEVERLAREWMEPQQRERVDGIASNRDLLGERLRRLHRGQGGASAPTPDFIRR